MVIPWTLTRRISMDSIVQRTCRSCERRTVRRRGKKLCGVCYADRTNRLKYQDSPLQVTCETRDHYGEVNPGEPTSAPPGSAEKIEVMRRRVENGEALHHPEDEKIISRIGSASGSRLTPITLETIVERYLE